MSLDTSLGIDDLKQIKDFIDSKKDFDERDSLLAQLREIKKTKKLKEDEIKNSIPTGKCISVLDKDDVMRYIAVEECIKYNPPSFVAIKKTFEIIKEEDISTFLTSSQSNIKKRKRDFEDVHPITRLVENVLNIVSQKTVSLIKNWKKKPHNYKDNIEDNETVQVLYNEISKLDEDIMDLKTKTKELENPNNIPMDKYPEFVNILRKNNNEIKYDQYYIKISNTRRLNLTKSLVRSIINEDFTKKIKTVDELLSYQPEELYNLFYDSYKKRLEQVPLKEKFIYKKITDDQDQLALTNDDDNYDQYEYGCEYEYEYEF